MIAIFKREIRNYLKRPLFWVGVLLVIYGVFNATSPYLTTHYLTTGEKIINDQSNTSVEGEVYEGYIPATPEKHREVWHEKVKIKLTYNFIKIFIYIYKIINPLMLDLVMINLINVY